MGGARAGERGEDACERKMALRRPEAQNNCPTADSPVAPGTRVSGRNIEPSDAHEATAQDSELSATGALRVVA